MTNNFIRINKDALRLVTTNICDMIKSQNK
jgi:hypothetical protein